MTASLARSPDPVPSDQGDEGVVSVAFVSNLCCGGATLMVRQTLDLATEREYAIPIRGS